MTDQLLKKWHELERSHSPFESDELEVDETPAKRNKMKLK